MGKRMNSCIEGRTDGQNRAGEKKGYLITNIQTNGKQIKPFKND